MMDRRKSLAAMAGWLTIAALSSAQPGAPGSPRLLTSMPTFLPEPSDPIIPAPKPLPKDPAPEKPIPKLVEPVIPIPKSGPSAEIVIPRRIEPQLPDSNPCCPPASIGKPHRPAATIGKPCCPAATIGKPYCAPPATSGVYVPPASIAKPNVGGNGSVVDGRIPRDDGSSFVLFSPVLRDTCYWFTPEYLLWNTSGMHVPALVTSSPAGTAAGNSGVLGDPSTSTLFGNQSMANGFRSGLRIGAGFWFDESQTLGLNATFLYLGQARQQQIFNSNGAPGIARPFFDSQLGIQRSEPIAFGMLNPGGSVSSTMPGTLMARVTSDLWGADIGLRRYLFETGNFRLDGVIGYRYQRLRDLVETNSNSTVNDATNAPFNLAGGTTIGIRDAFESTNDFQGGQIGLASQWQYGRFSIGLNAKVALGVNERAVQINGSTTIAVPGSTTQTFPGGLLALPTINGRYSSSAFSVIPDVGVNVGFQLTPNIRVFAGYSFMYWTNVARAGDQISTTLNTSQVTRTLAPATLSGAALPTFVLHETNYWAQGANAGIELRW